MWSSAVVASLLVGALLAAEDELREWTDTTGTYKVKATIVGIAEGKVALRKEDGVVIKVPLVKLQPEDRKFAIAWRAAQAKAPVEPKPATPLPADPKPKPGTPTPSFEIKPLDGQPLGNPLPGGFDAARVVADLRAAGEIRFQPARTLAGIGQGPAVALGFSGDGKRLAAAYNTGEMVVWDLAARKEISRLPKPLQALTISIAMNSDGSLVLLGGDQKRGGLLVKAETCEQVFVHNAPQTEIIKVGITKGDQFAVLCTKGGVFHRFPLRGGQGGSFTALEGADSFGFPADASFAVVGSSTSSKVAIGIFPQGDQPFSQVVLPLREGRMPRLVAGARKTFYMLFDQELLAHALPTPAAPTGMQGSMPIRVRSGHALVTADDNFLVLVGPKLVEYRPIAAPAAVWIGACQPTPLVSAAVSSDGRMIARGGPDGTITIEELNRTPETSTLRLARVVQSLVIEKRWGDLEALCERLDADPTPFDVGGTDTPISLFRALLATAGGAPEAMEPLKSGVERWAAERPEARLPKVIAAEQRIKQAWAIRGGGVAATVTPEQWQGFRAEITKARELIVSVVDDPKAPAAAFQTLFTVAMAESWPEARLQPYVDRHLKNHPLNSQGHAALMLKLMPRWGGEPNDCADYASQVAGLIGGPAGDAMYAQLAMTQIDFYGEDYFDVTQFDYERMKRGLAHLAQNGPARHYFKHRGLYLAWRKKDVEGAKQFWGLMADEREQEGWQLNWWASEGHFRAAQQLAKQN